MSDREEKYAEARIMVVDDEPFMRKSLVELLALNGFQSHPAAGGEAAIGLLQQQERFDLVLLDLNMPGVDGHQVMEYVNKNALDTDVIVVSGEATFNEAAWALQKGAHDFIRKPYNVTELLHSIKKCLHKRQLEAEHRLIQKRLAHSERCHRFFVNNSPDIIYMLDKRGNFSFLNERASKLLGYSRHELMGRHYSMVVFADDIDKARLAFDAQRAGQQPVRNVEFRLVCKKEAKGAAVGGQLLTVELNAAGIYEEVEASPEKRFVGTYGVIRDVTERKRAEELINHQRYHDVLTSLPNRALFWDRLEVALCRARRNSQMLAVMFLNLDGFKVINDSLGHLTGDELLQAVAYRLRGCLREGDTLARAGGDEFHLLLPEVGGREDAAAIAEKIIANLKHPVTLDGHEVCVGLSIGIALFPDDGVNMEALTRHADMAMYHIKARGKNGYEFFSDSMMGRISRHFALEQGLRQALEENQFILFYQPQYDVASGEITGVEALIRWQHPKKGMISPGDFIPLAEETGLITEIGDWVLRASCAEWSRWRKAGILDAKMAVNLSAAQLYRTDFVDNVLSVLREYRMPGECLELEITENMLMQDMEHVSQKLKQLTLHGVRISVDDFGTGYSSLGYLESLPLTKLKMDRSFVKPIHSSDGQHSIVAAIVTMAKGLGLDVIAEGVETEAQLEYLRSIDCPKVQGFLLSVPLSADHTMALLSGHTKMACC
jgi:diguanylate cyclase (GGDEF)-like protein/PAS domain S-box-containing protein